MTAASASFLKDQALKEAQDLSEVAAENLASRKKAALRKKAVLTKNVQVVLTAIAVSAPKKININSPYPYNYPYGNQKYCHYCPR